MVHPLREAFVRWSDIEAVSNGAPLYQALGHVVAEHAGLLSLAEETRPGQPAPNMFFGAVHSLLRTNSSEPLAAYYPSCGGNRPPDRELSAIFVDFCLRHQTEMADILQVRMVQTNEVRRSAVLLPAFAAVAADSGQPLALYEIGPSAGLNLLFDKFGYNYGGSRDGDESSPVQLDCDPRGNPPRVPIPGVVARVGCDINPLSVTNDSDMEWLRSLTWPEHADRLALLNAAIALALQSPPVLVRADVFGDLPVRVLAFPDGATPCVFASFVLNQFSQQDLQRLRSTLLEVSLQRTVYVVVMGFSGFVETGRPFDGTAETWVLRLGGGKAHKRLISRANPHGRWMELCDPAEWTPWMWVD